MLKSMTGFGVARRDVGDFHLVVEVKAVNGRFLKTSIKLPNLLSASESMLEGCIKERLRRGSVTLSVFLTRVNATAQISINEPVVRAYQEAFARLQLDPACIPTLPGVLGGPAEREEAPEALLHGLKDCADEALAHLDGMRGREGTALRAVLGDLCEQVEMNRSGVRERAPVVVREYQQKLSVRLATLLAGVEQAAALDEAILARETALFADRADITEEVDRLGAHLQQIRLLLGQDGEVGRTLDFLAQEMHREVNTMGSKSADSDLSRVVVQLKADVERFKEQVANIE